MFLKLKGKRESADILKCQATVFAHYSMTINYLQSRNHLIYLKKFKSKCKYISPDILKMSAE